MHKIILNLLFLFFYSNSHAQIQAFGDTMLGTNISIANNLLAPVQELLNKKGSINLINLEGVITDKSYSKKCLSGLYCYVFQMPDKIAQILANNNIHIANLANNHSMDLGHLGQKDTVQNLLKNGIFPIGLMQEYSEKIVSIYNKEHVFIGLSPHKNTYSIFDTQLLDKVIKQHKEKNRIVVITAHIGAEGENAYKVFDKEEYFLGANRGNPVKIAHALIDSGADLFLGHGPHVMRPIELYKDRLIVYSLGNFLTYGTFNLKGKSGLGGMIRVYLQDDGKFKEGQFFGYQQTKDINNKNWQQGIALQRSKESESFLKKISELHQEEKLKWNDEGKITLK